MLEHYVKGNDGELVPVHVASSDYAKEAGWAIRAQYDNNGADIALTYLKSIAIKQSTLIINTTSWVTNTKTAELKVDSITVSSLVYVAPTKESADDVVKCDIVCTTQASGSITFTCNSIPTKAVVMEVLILNI